MLVPRWSISPIVLFTLATLGGVARAADGPDAATRQKLQAQAARKAKSSSAPGSGGGLTLDQGSARRDRVLVVPGVVLADAELPTDGLPPLLVEAQTAVLGRDPGENADAQSVLHYLLRQDPDDARAEFLLGQTWMILAHPAQAERNFRRARDLGIEPLLVDRWILEALTERDRPEDAVAHVSQMRVDYPDDRYVVYDLARALMVLPAPAKAAQAAQDACDLDVEPACAAVGPLNARARRAGQRSNRGR